jgi:hypothetical protein
MSRSATPGPSPSPVTADDLDRAVQLAVAVLREAPQWSDPEGFAAMGVVETLVHTHDLAEGLGLAWTPPSDLCSRVLARLFPDAPKATGPWPTPVIDGKNRRVVQFTRPHAEPCRRVKDVTAPAPVPPRELVAVGQPAWFRPGD